MYVRPLDLALASIPREIIAMPATIKVSRVGGTTTDSLPKITYTTTEAVTIPEEIFVHKVDDRGSSYDTYVGVASLNELDSLPSIRVSVGRGNYYRKSTAELEFSSFNSAIRANEEIEFAIRDLLAAYNSAQSIVNLDDVLEV